MRARGAVSFLVSFMMALCSTACAPSAPGASKSPAHPLDGLTTGEISSVVEALRSSGKLSDGALFHIINLHEPPKSEVLDWRSGDTFRREAFAIVKQGVRAFEAIVDVSGLEVKSWKKLEGVQPNVLLEEEMGGAGEAAKKHPDWQAAMHLRGITDFESLDCGALSPGYYGLAAEAGRRLGKVICFDMSAAKNAWGRPIEGLTTLVDLNTLEVLEVIDTGSVPMPTAPADYDEESTGPRRHIPTPISVRQTEGPSFSVNGHEVTWQKWSFHFRIDPRVGLVVSTVRYADGGKQRSILYQGSLSELFVPYMDPALGWYWRTYMDGGEYLVGANAVSLIRKVDCPGNARYFDVAFADDRGEAQITKRAACLFERYAGDVAWRHTESSEDKPEARKKRDLVLRIVATIGNYDYTFDWTFQQDGTIRVGVGASGIEQVKAVHSRTITDEGGRQDATYGRFVSENTVAVNHDHFYSFRLDLDVDGPDNSFLREKLRTVRVGEESPRTSVWVLDGEIAQVEAQAKLRINLEKPALWRVINPGVLGPVGYPVSYQITPAGNAVSLMAPDDFPQRRAGFTNYHVWVTPYRPEERYAAGDYPAQSQGGDGLPNWTRENRPIEDTDIVVWYTLGNHHVVRAEDWPVLPTAWRGFELRPFDFFERNPALDLPAGP